MSTPPFGDICTRQKFDANGKPTILKHNVGKIEFTSNDRAELSFFDPPNTEYFALKTPKNRNTTATLWNVYNQEFETKVGVMRCTKNGGIYLTMSRYPETTYFIFRPQNEAGKELREIQY